MRSQTRLLPLVRVPFHCLLIFLYNHKRRTETFQFQPPRGPTWGKFPGACNGWGLTARAVSSEVALRLQGREWKRPPLLRRGLGCKVYAKTRALRGLHCSEKNGLRNAQARKLGSRWRNRSLLKICHHASTTNGLWVWIFISGNHKPKVSIYMELGPVMRVDNWQKQTTKAPAEITLDPGCVSIS